MKPAIRAAALLLLLAVIVSVCSGCGREEPKPAIPTAPAVSTEAARRLPQPGKASLELDGAEPVPLLELDGNLYLEAGYLAERLALNLTEPEAETLLLQGESGSVTLRSDARTAEWVDGAKPVLSAPVLHGAGSWYLPLSALETLWNRKLFFDPEQALYRALSPEPGPELCFNGSPAAKTLLLGGVPTVEAETLAGLLHAEPESGSAPDGTRLLTLRTEAHSLSLREDASSAELDGEALALPAPAWRDEGRWYLPLAAAEALDCVTAEEPTGELGLWTRSEGPALWFDGTGLGSSVLVGEAPCAPLSALAEALGGSLTQTEDALQLEAEGRTLCFRPGSREASLDGEPLPLPAPVIELEGDCYVPAASLAEALALPRLEGEALIYSRMEQAETLLFVDGRQTTAWARGEEPSYLRLNEVFFAEENEPLPDGNTLRFSFRGKSVSLTGGSPEIALNGEAQRLSAPVRADGESWYAPTELLSALGLRQWEDPELDQIYYTHIVPHDSLAEGYRVPVLMYHAVSDNIWGIPELFISPSTLEAQIQALLEGGYTAITFEDLDRIDEIEKPVMLTFDDGYDDNYTELFPLLKKYNVKATVFIIVNDLGKNHKLTKAQVKEMSDSGLVSIQSHTMSHGYLDSMYDKQLRYEHYDSMLALARITGKQPFVMCYPTGRSAGYTREITAEYYEYGLCMGGPCWVTGEAPYRIYRYYIPRKTTLDTFLSYLAG